MKLLRSIYIVLFFIGVFLIPFNGIGGVPMLREYSQEAAIYPWLIGGLLTILEGLYKKKIYFPFKDPIVLMVLIFVGWCVLTYVINIVPIQGNYFKYRSGNSRFVSQLISLCLSAVFLVYYFWNVLRDWSLKMILYRIRSILWYSFLIVYTYAIIELLVSRFNLQFARVIISFLNYLPILNKVDFYSNRLSSVSFEVPALGNFLILIAGWMFSYLLTEKNRTKGLIASFMVLSLVLLSGARAAMVIVLFQTCILIYLLLAVRRMKPYILLTIRVVLGGVFCLILFKGTVILDKVTSRMDFFNVESNISNQTRYGMQYATLKVFKENPICGVGFGQNTFYKRHHYPEWAIKNNYEFTDWYLNEDVYNFPPDFNLYIRLLSETGIIGLFLFLLLLTLCFKQSFKGIHIANKEGNVLAFIALITFVGLTINWMQLDYFRQYGFWLCIVVLIRVIQVSTIKQTAIGK